MSNPTSSRGPGAGAGAGPSPAATSVRSRKSATAVPPTSTLNRTAAGAAGRSGSSSGSGGRNSSRSREVVAARRRRRVDDDAGFAGFLSKLVKVLFLPITIPSRISYNLLTSPTTISTTIKLVLFSSLLVLSAGFTAVALAGFWYAGIGRAGGVVDVEGWFVYGSKTSPTPHAYIPLPHPEKLFAQGVGYDVDVTMELVRPRRVDAEETGNFMLGVEFYSQATGAVVTSVSQPCLPAQPYTAPSIPSRLINTITAPALFFLRLPFILNPTSLIFNPLNLIRSSSSSGINKRRKLLKSGKETFILNRPVISSFAQNTYAPSLTSSGGMARGGSTSFEGKGLVMRPDGSGRGKAGTIGAVQVTVGREDGALLGSGRGKGEVKTTGWVVVSFTPRPTGLRYIFASHPMIPLLTIPPIAFFMTLSSATLGYFIISLFFSSARPVQAKSQPRRSIDNRPTGSATIGGSGKKALDTGGSVVQDDIPPRTETSTPTFKDGAVLPNTPSAEKGPTLPPSDGSAAHATPSMQQRQPDRGTVAGEGKTSSTTGTTSGSSVTSSTSTAGDDSSESGTVTH